MAFIDLFSDKMGLYAATRPHYPDALFAHIARLAPSLEGAWDLGTGNGQAATSLWVHFGRVLASDTSAEQIANARLAPNVRYSVHGVTTGSASRQTSIKFFSHPSWNSLRRTGHRRTRYCVVATPTWIFRSSGLRCRPLELSRTGTSFN